MTTTRWIVGLAIVSYSVGIILNLVPPNDGLNLANGAVGLFGIIAAGSLVAFQERRAVQDLAIEKTRLQEESETWKTKFLDQQKEVGRNLISGLLQMVRSMAQDDTEARACCFLALGDNVGEPQLKFFDGSGAFDEHERQLRFGKRDWLAGVVWSTNNPIFADPRSREDAEPTLKEINNKMRSLLSVPIRIEDEPIGVLSIDSQLPLDETKFSTVEMVQKMEAAADILAKILQTSGMV